MHLVTLDAVLFHLIYILTSVSSVNQQVFDDGVLEAISGFVSDISYSKQPNQASIDTTISILEAQCTWCSYEMRKVFNTNHQLSACQVIDQRDGSMVWEYYVNDVILQRYPIGDCVMYGRYGVIAEIDIFNKQFFQVSIFDVASMDKQRKRVLFISLENEAQLDMYNVNKVELDVFFGEIHIIAHHDHDNGKRQCTYGFAKNIDMKNMNTNVIMGRTIIKEENQSQYRPNQTILENLKKIESYIALVDKIIQLSDDSFHIQSSQLAYRHLQSFIKQWGIQLRITENEWKQPFGKRIFYILLKLLGDDKMVYPRCAASVDICLLSIAIDQTWHGDDVLDPQEARETEEAFRELREAMEFANSIRKLMRP